MVRAKTAVIAQKKHRHVNLVDQNDAPSSRLNNTPPTATKYKQTHINKVRETIHIRFKENKQSIQHAIDGAINTLVIMMKHINWSESTKRVVSMCVLVVLTGSTECGCNTSCCSTCNKVSLFLVVSKVLVFGKRCIHTHCSGFSLRDTSSNDCPNMY